MIKRWIKFQVTARLASMARIINSSSHNTSRCIIQGKDKSEIRRAEKYFKADDYKTYKITRIVKIIAIMSQRRAKKIDPFIAKGKKRRERK